MKDYEKKKTLDRAPRSDGGDRKPYGEKKPYGDRKPYDGEKKPYGDRKPYDDEKKPYGDRKPYDGERKPYGDRKPYDGERKPYGDRKPYDGERKPYDGERKPYGDRKPYDGEKKPYDGERKPYGRSEEPARRDFRKPADALNVRLPRPVDEPAAQQLEDELPLVIMGRQAVKEAIKSGRSINSVLVQEEPDGSLREIIGLARDRNLIIREVKREKLDELCMPFGHGGKTGNHQGIAAMIPGIEYAEVADMLALAKERGEAPFLVLLDGIEDPHNLGSIIRSAECAGAHGVIIPRRRSAQVTGAVIKASAGATENMLIARVANIRTEMERLKAENIWLCGADMTGEPMARVNMKGALALVIGGEGDGLSEHVRRDCDMLAAIPMRGKTGSLNAGVAAAVLMFEKRRQDG